MWVFFKKLWYITHLKFTPDAHSSGQVLTSMYVNHLYNQDLYMITTKFLCRSLHAEPQTSPIRLVSPQISFIYTRISSKWIHRTILSFHARCCIHLEFHSFLLLSSIPLYGYTTIHQVMNTWVNYRVFLIFIYIHKYAFADTHFKWFRVTPACFPEANVLFYTVINSKD